jgi:cytochrome b6-f complex iron-sulfur subunit
VTRRSFLKWLIGALGLISLGGVLYPVVRYLKPPTAVSGAIGQVTSVGAVSSFPAGQLTAITIGGQPAYVVQQGGVYAVHSLICTHLGCVVGVNGDKLHCPCHGSDYAPNGTVIHGPAKLPLPPYHAKVQNGNLLVGAVDLSGAAYPGWYVGEFA